MSDNAHSDPPSSTVNFSGTYKNYSSGTIQIWTNPGSGNFTTNVDNDSYAGLNVSDSVMSPPITSGSAGPHSVNTGALQATVSWVWDVGSSTWKATYNVATKTQSTTESVTSSSGTSISAAGTQQYWAATLS
ncbi:MAG: hypothetical protein ACYC96_15295 [Fimbriimonadaceae bacterium]